jgi:molybdopterin/thiamine biosynthesis adenylyltransferase
MAGEVLLVGAGGIGAPAAWALGEAGIARLRVVDDDEVELSNLHRQILFSDEDVGRPKLEAFAEALQRRFPRMEVASSATRAHPGNVLDLMAGAAVVLDATDNFATRFLLADAAHLVGVPIVHAAAVRWQATVMAVAGGGRPCYRCLFEDIPTGVVVDCATAGVAGPVCGVSGALGADRVLRILGGEDSAFGRIVSFDGTRDRLREVAVPARQDCDLCSERARIGAIETSRYTGEPPCAASD